MTDCAWMADDAPDSLAGMLRAMDHALQPRLTDPAPALRNDMAALLRHAGMLIEGFSNGPHTHFGMIAAALALVGDNLENLFTTPEAVAEFQARCGLSDDDIARLIFVGGRQ